VKLGVGGAPWILNYFRNGNPRQFSISILDSLITQ
jgi:hypothetical protein